MATNISIRLMFIALLIGVSNAQAPAESPSIAEAPTSVIGVPSNAQAPSPDSASLLGLGDSKATNPRCATANLLSIIKKAVIASVNSDMRMGASLLRLHFHDCFVNGCDGSVLLDDNSTTGFVGEKTAAPNAGTLRGFDVIDNIKTLVETSCPRTLSCADILAVAARDAVVALGGPSWNLAFGRKDSTNASIDDANNILPGPSSELSDLISSFSAQGFTTAEMVALSGSHTIGQANCSFFRNRIYTDTNIDPKFANATKLQCPQSGGDENLSPLDVLSPNKFNNDYYKNLVGLKGLLHSDQVLFNNGTTDAQVRSYVATPAKFFADFSKAMVKMAALPPASGAVGQIRTNCRRVN